MWDSVEGERQPGDRVRTLGRIPIQSRDALSERCEALHAEFAPGPPTVAINAPCFGISKRLMGRGAFIHSDKIARSAAAIWPRRSRGLWRRLVDHGEDIPSWKVCARGTRHTTHRLQRPLVHGVRRNGLQAGFWRRSIAK